MELLKKLHPYKHISFDLWLTLIKSNPNFKERRNLLFREFFSIDLPIAEVAATIRKFDLLTNTINEKVGRNFDTFEIYYLILDGLGIGVDTFSQKHLEEFYALTESLLLEHVPVLMDASLPQQLHELKNLGKSMNIMSNTAFIKGKSLRKVLEHYGIDSCFDFQVYSDEIGYSKPSAQIYKHTFKKIQALGLIEKHEVLHVGDNKVADFDGAVHFGFDAHLITNSTNEHHLQPA